LVCTVKVAPCASTRPRGPIAEHQGGAQRTDPPEECGFPSHLPSIMNCHAINSYPDILIIPIARGCWRLLTGATSLLKPYRYRSVTIATNSKCYAPFNSAGTVKFVCYPAAKRLLHA